MMNITANLPEIYEEVVETIRASVEAAHGPTTITCPTTPSECISTKKTYSYEFHCRDSMLFTLPKIVMEAPYDRRGYFIIDVPDMDTVMAAMESPGAAGGVEERAGRPHRR